MGAAAISNKEIVIQNIIAAMGPIMEAVQLQALENVIRQNMHGLTIEEECTALSTWLDDNEHVIKVFLASKKLEGCKRVTLIQYKTTAYQFFGQIRKNYREVTKDDIKVYLAWRMQHVKPNTLLNTKRNLSSFFGWLHEEGYISTNPVKKGGMRIDEVCQIRLTPEEEVRVRDVEKSVKEQAIVDFLFSTGVRVGELAAMNISDVDFARRSVTFRGEKGNCSFRTVLLDAAAKKHLEDYLRTRTDDNPALFVTDRLYNGQPRRMRDHGIETVTKAVGRRAGLDKTLTVHVFRRTFATRLADKQCPREVIQMLMGHKKAETTDRYMGKSEERIIAAASKFFSAA